MPAYESLCSHVHPCPPCASTQVTPTDVLGMKDSEARYSLLTNEAGGIIDDCIITRITGDELYVAAPS